MTRVPMSNDHAVQRSWLHAMMRTTLPKGEPRVCPPKQSRGRLRTAIARLADKRLNLALQGGGAHGAFTWGVLEALLEQPHIRFDGVSGTSAGAVNAVALADGLMRGGRDGARQRLAEVWNDISRAGAPGSHPSFPMAQSPAALIAGAVVRRGLAHLGNTWAPYQLNPLNINPLRDILLERIDFEALRRRSPVKLFIAATEVASGRARIFRSDEATVDVVMASACLPTLFAAVEIDGCAYWDGGFSANPDLVTLIPETSAGDTLLVQITPDHNPDPPASNDEIAQNIARLSFTKPLRDNVELLEMWRRAPLRPGRAARRLGRHRMHLIDGSPHTQHLDAETKSHPDWRMINGLREQGHSVAATWVDEHLGHVGKRATADLYAKYFR